MSQVAQSFRTIGNVSTTSDPSINLTNGLLNTTIGAGASLKNITGVENTVIGTNALLSSTGGSGIVAIGCLAAQGIIAAGGAVLVGDRVAPLMLTGFDSVVVGYTAAANVLSAQGTVLLGPNISTTSANQFSLVDVVGIGSAAAVSGFGSISVGARSIVTGDGAVSVGHANTHTASGGVTLGSFCANAGSDSVVIGNSLSSVAPNSVTILAGSGLGALNIQNVLTGGGRSGTSASASASAAAFDVQLGTSSGTLSLSALGTSVNGGMSVDALSSPSIRVTSNAAYWNIALSTSTDAWADLSLTSSHGTQVSFCDDFVAGVLNFTAQHRCVLQGGFSRRACPRPGSVLIATGRFRGLDGSTEPTIDEAVPVVALSSVARDRRVFGVVSSSEDGTMDRRTFRVGSLGFSVPRSAVDGVVVNSGGEGGILVCDANGPIQNGDLLVTSPHPGLAMRQDDDIVRSSTVAKATCDCLFGADVNETETLIGCVYMC